jgi:signal transduction histidine kinase
MVGDGRGASHVVASLSDLRTMKSAAMEMDLSICRSIAEEACGGRISVNPVVVLGARFFVQQPIPEEALW